MIRLNQLDYLPTFQYSQGSVQATLTQQYCSSSTSTLVRIVLDGDIGAIINQVFARSALLHSIELKKTQALAYPCGYAHVSCSRFHGIKDMASPSPSRGRYMGLIALTPKWPWHVLCTAALLTQPIFAYL